MGFNVPDRFNGISEASEGGFRCVSGWVRSLLPPLGLLNASVTCMKAAENTMELPENPPQNTCNAPETLRNPLKTASVASLKPTENILMFPEKPPKFP